jgi:hypothetical protein
MHEPSSRPFARRERNNVVGRKTVSVEGQVQGFKVSESESFKDKGSGDARRRLVTWKL